MKTGPKKLRWLLFSIVPLLLALPSHIVQAHNIPNGPAPLSTTSYYVGNINTQTLYNKGCDQGHSSGYNGTGPANGLVFLAFGQPAYENGVYGAYVYAPGSPFYNTGQIADGVESFANGFWSCTPFNGPRLRIGIGTTNQQGIHGSVTYGHGRAWAELVTAVDARLGTHPGWRNQLSVVGANDMELSFSSPGSASNHPDGTARAWIAGYMSDWTRPYYDFGDAGGCYPYNGSPWQPNGWNCNNGWTAEDVWWKTYGSPVAQSVPEIYFARNQQDPRIGGQWSRISLYAYINHGAGRIFFQGSTTQYDACEGYSSNHSHDGACWASHVYNVGEFTNTAAEGWGQLLYKLNNNDPAYHGDASPPSTCVAPPSCHRTNQASLPWSTDMSKALEH